MEFKAACPHCGNELAEDAPNGQCGQCLLLLGLNDTSAGGSSPKMSADDAHSSNRHHIEAGECNRPGSAAGHQGSIEVIHHFGDYELLEEIDRGGMGVVYKARQTSLNRIVAVKLILGGPLAHKQFVERFRQEARAAANLQHPNIVAIHEVGEVRGQHYFSMDYVEGEDLAALVRNLKGVAIDSRRAAMWMKGGAEAIHYAHQRGTIHRDLKPSNILIDRNDRPWITDFGLATSLKSRSELTASGQVLGTPSFLPPEQASGLRTGVGPASDVYGLGAVLYFLLTGRAPFMGETLEATVTQVLNQEPVAPRVLNPGVPNDLETICMKCLEKDLRRRYASARELADDLGRFLQGRPILARPIGTVGRVWRWCRRKPVVAGLGACSTLALVLGSAGVTWQWMRTEQERQHQRRLAYVADMRAAQLALEQDRKDLARTLLRQHRIMPGDGEDLRGIEWQYLWRQCLSDNVQRFVHPSQLKDIALSPDGKKLATLAWDNRVRVWDASTGRLVNEFASQSFPSPRKSLAFSSDGTKLLFPGPGGIEVLETSKWTLLQVLEGAVSPLCISSDGDRLVSVHPGNFRVQAWDLRDRTKNQLSTGPVTFYNLALSPDGRQIALCRANPFWGHLREVLLLDTQSSRVEVLQEQSDSMSLTISHDGKWLASGHWSGDVCCWRLSDRQLVARFKAHDGSAYGLAFSADSKVLVTGGTDARIRLWEVGTTNCLESWSALSPVTVLSLSQNGEWLAAASWTGRTVRLWGLQGQESAAQTFAVPSDTVALGSLPDGKAIVTFKPKERISHYWRLPDGQLIRSNVWDVSRLRGCTELRCFPANGRAVGVDPNGTVHLWDLVTQAHIRTVAIGGPGFTPDYLSQNGQWLLGHRSDNSGVLCDLRAGRTASIFPGQKSYTYPADFSPDGRWLAYCVDSLTIKLWDLAASRERRIFEPAGFYVTVLRFSPDSKVLASGYADATLKLWSVKTGKLMLPPLRGHQSMLHQIAFSRDGRTLVSSDTDVTTHWWNVATGREMLLMRESSMVGGSEYLAFESHYGQQARPTAGGKWMVQQGRNGAIRVTPLPTLAEMDAREEAIEAEERAGQASMAGTAHDPR